MTLLDIFIVLLFWRMTRIEPSRTYSGERAQCGIATTYGIQGSETTDWRAASMDGDSSLCMPAGREGGSPQRERSKVEEHSFMLKRPAVIVITARVFLDVSFTESFAEAPRTSRTIRRLITYHTQTHPCLLGSVLPYSPIEWLQMMPDCCKKNYSPRGKLLKRVRKCRLCQDGSYAKYGFPNRKKK